MTHDSGTGYQLTPLGRDLLTAFDPLLRWSVRWMKAVDASVERQARG